MSDALVSPYIEDVIAVTGSKFAACTLAATRAREINAYFGQLGEGLGAMVPPQVTSVARKPLSIAFEEMVAGKIVGVRPESGERVEQDLGRREVSEVGSNVVNGSLAQAILDLQADLFPSVSEKRAVLRSNILAEHLIKKGTRPSSKSEIEDLVAYTRRREAAL